RRGRRLTRAFTHWCASSVMNRPKQLLFELQGTALFGQADPKTLETLKQAASLWRAEGQHLNAGFVMSLASHAAWGNGEEVDACTRLAINDYLACVNTAPVVSHEALVALTKVASEVRQWFTGEARIGAFIKSAETELAQRLVNLSRADEHRCAYLVTGYAIGT